MSDTIFKQFENLRTHFNTYHTTPRTLFALARVIPSLARKIAGRGVNRFAGKCQGGIFGAVSRTFFRATLVKSAQTRP